MIMEGQVACTAWISSFGDPADVLEVIDLPEPEAPGPCEALLGMETRTRQPERPAVVGSARARA